MGRTLAQTADNKGHPLPRRLKFSTPDEVVQRVAATKGAGPEIIEVRRATPPTAHSKPVPTLQKKPHYPRLPDGAVFNASYDGTAMKWSGTLIIGDITLTAETNGVFTLMRVLDAKYRARVTPAPVTP